MEFEIITPNRGKKQVLHNKFIFLKEKSLNSKEVYKCQKFKTRKCRLHISGEKIIKEIGEHSHPI